jgi:PKD repeat protein
MTQPSHQLARSPSRGQSIVEFALVLPVVLLILMVGLDFGRVFLGWVNLNNTARIAANFAATNATALAGTGVLHDDAMDRYQALIENDAQTINCTLPTPVPGPTFPGGTGLGQPAQVAITCNFGVITPIISNILGTSVKVSAAADFPIRTGLITGVPTGGGGGGVNAAFNVSPSSGTAPLTVTFSDVSSGSPTTYAWDLTGDSVTDSTQVGGSLTYEFTMPGTFFVSLRVSNGTSTDTATQVVTVNAPPGPLVNFTATPTTGSAPLVVAFTNSSSGTNPLSYLWDFGDGTTSTAKTPPNKTYGSAATRVITLTVTDKDGLANSATQTITIGPAIPQCTVPNFKNVDTSPQVQLDWQAAGFDTTVIFNPSRPPEFKIKSQSPAAGSSQPCSGTVVTVSK